MKTLISTVELAKIIANKNPILRGEIAPREYTGLVIGDYVPDGNGKNIPQIWGITKPTLEVQQQYNVKPQRFLRITPEVKTGGAHRTDRNNVPFNVFEQQYRGLFADIVKALESKINDYTEIEVRAVNGSMVKHPSWKLPFTILGYAAKVAVPKYWLQKPGTREKWIINRMNPLTGQGESTVATDRYLRYFLTTDDCDAPLEAVVAEAERRVLPFIEGERESVLRIGGIEVSKEHEVKPTLTDQEKSELQQNEQTLSPSDLQ